MGLFDEVQCDAELPDGLQCLGVLFQTKSFPEPMLERYRITRSGRLIDSRGNDLEPDGYITIYTTAHSRAAPTPNAEWREYRARFVSGQLQGIERIDDKPADPNYYGLASFKWFGTRPNSVYE